ncbi:MAG: TRAP transporter large permease [Rhodobiaceae bacterium]|nr:TRAP transporter large permease [Rhodobiaceae bacterium]MCC0015678.1 TRAP transporter large permease [Rhodobiaceae bacterium]MCC0042216.1 TRAP transporter large permease [Rhodobiaceae bacterium]
MDAQTIGTLAIAAMLGMMALRIPIAVAMLVAGMGGYVAIAGVVPLLAYLKTGPFAVISNYSLSVVPLFLLMGNLATRSGLSRALFAAANASLGSFRGGLAMAAIGGCAMFGAICGSSLATAATMGRVALPEMKRYGYSDALATGTLAAGGTLGILIPPSVVLVIYAIITEQNVAKMFLAAFVPGILAAIGYMLAIAVYVRLHPEAVPASDPMPARERWQAYRQASPAAAIFVMVIGGIYTGVFTPTEAAAFGVVGTGAVALWKGMRLDDVLDVFVATAVSTAMIFMILLGADIFNAFLARTQLPQALAEAVSGSGAHPYLVLGAILLMYLLLGCVMDSLSMILLTIPIFFPVVMALDFGMSEELTAIWFGIITLIVVEVGLITPPVGMNVFVINRLAQGVPITATFRGVLPFLTSDFIRVAILIAFPVLTVGILRLF